MIPLTTVLPALRALRSLASPNVRYLFTSFLMSANCCSFENPPESSEEAMRSATQCRASLYYFLVSGRVVPAETYLAIVGCSNTTFGDGTRPPRSRFCKHRSVWWPNVREPTDFDDCRAQSRCSQGVYAPRKEIHIRGKFVAREVARTDNVIHTV